MFFQNQRYCSRTLWNYGIVFVILIIFLSSINIIQDLISGGETSSQHGNSMSAVISSGRILEDVVSNSTSYIRGPEYLTSVEDISSSKLMDAGKVFNRRLEKVCPPKTRRKYPGVLIIGIYKHRHKIGKGVDIDVSKYSISLYLRGMDGGRNGMREDSEDEGMEGQDGGRWDRQ